MKEVTTVWVIGTSPKSSDIITYTPFLNKEAADLWLESSQRDYPKTYAGARVFKKTTVVTFEEVD